MNSFLCRAPLARKNSRTSIQDRRFGNAKSIMAATAARGAELCVTGSVRGRGSPMDEVLVNYFGSTFRSRVVNVCVSVCTHTKRAHVSARCTRLAQTMLWLREDVVRQCWNGGVQGVVRLWSHSPCSGKANCYRRKRDLL